MPNLWAPLPGREGLGWVAQRAPVRDYADPSRMPQRPTMKVVPNIEPQGLSARPDEWVSDDRAGLA